jgi:hypothetical protein
LPGIATVDELHEYRSRAVNSLYRCLDIWFRYCRRYDRLGTPINLAPLRLFIRYVAATEAWQRRCWLTGMLVEREPEGNA